MNPHEVRSSYRAGARRNHGLLIGLMKHSQHIEQVLPGRFVPDHMGPDQRKQLAPQRHRRF